MSLDKETLHKADEWAQEPDSSSKGGYATEARDSNTQARSDQMENDLELKKSNKVSNNDPKDVAGRHEKGVGLVDKLVGR